MVQLTGSVSQSISVEVLPLLVETNLTILSTSLPASGEINQGETFRIFGLLTRADNGVGIDGMGSAIALQSGVGGDPGADVTYVVTDAGAGNYAIDVTINNFGARTFRLQFGGAVVQGLAAFTPSLSGLISAAIPGGNIGLLAVLGIGAYLLLK